LPVGQYFLLKLLSGHQIKLKVTLVPIYLANNLIKTLLMGKLNPEYFFLADFLRKIKIQREVT
jgi:hypothetical protein